MKRKISFKIEGMTCAVCAGVNEKALKALSGVEEASVNLATKKAQLVYDDKAISLENIFSAIREEGYTPVLEGEDEGFRKLKELRKMRAQLLISAVFASMVLYLSMGPMVGLPQLFEPAQNPLLFVALQLSFTLIVMGTGISYYTAGFKNLFRLRPNMDSLVALGTSAAFIYSLAEGARAISVDAHAVHNLYFESVAVIIALVKLGKYLEMRSIGKAGEAVKKLLDMTPKQASVLRPDGLEEKIAVSEVKAGDILIARPGDSIAVDGVIVKGTSYIDEAMLTGESIGVEKKGGDRVFAGTINKSGMIAYRAERIGKDTVLSKIISIVEEAQGSKAPIARLTDKVFAVFVPIVSAIAVLSFIGWLAAGYEIAFALNAMVSVFVIACPCALGLATPAAIITGTGKGAQLGILFKSAESLEALSHVKTIVFDKTGTLTEGRPHVVSINPAEGFSEIEVLRYAVAAEKGSSHPIAEAIVAEAEGRFIELPEASGFVSTAGRGVEAIVRGRRVKAGNLAFFERDGEAFAEAQKAAAGDDTAVIVAVDGKFAGWIALRDVVKPDTLRALSAIRGMGIKAVMLTGDNKRVAEKIASECGIDEVIAEVLPDGKSEAVESIKQKGKVAMVGDGINDAPALAVADVGIAVGGGTDIAIESADIALMGRSLLGVADALALSKKVMKNIRENLFWAFIYNVIGIPLAAGLLYPSYGLLLNPMVAALAMSLSSVSVVMNALRLNLFRSRFAGK